MLSRSVTALLPSKLSIDYSAHLQDRQNNLVAALDADPARGRRLPTKTRPSRSAGPSHEGPSSSRSLFIPRTAHAVAVNAVFHSNPPPTKDMSNKPLPSTPASQQLQPHFGVPNQMNSTIRAVRSFDNGGRPRERERELDRARSEDSSTDGTRSPSESRNSAFSSSVTSNGSAVSAHFKRHSDSHLQLTSKGQQTSGSSAKQVSVTAVITPLDESTSTLTPPRAPGANFLDQAMTRSSFDIPQRESSLSAPTMTINTNMQKSHAEPPGDLEAPGWDSTVGKAGLGKTGRVINKLVSENDALKREIKIEKLRADEAKEAARVLEDKMSRLTQDYESRLMDASVTKTVLSRRERQVETLQAMVEQERKRAQDADERERGWKAEMERLRVETKLQVDEAGNHAALMEGRYNAISSHWREQGAEAKGAMAKMAADISALREERRQDDDKIATLRELCDQQDANMRDLLRQKETLAAQYELYKAEQELLLRDIKRNASIRQEEMERAIHESREALEKLRWALSVKENINWAK